MDVWNGNTIVTIKYEDSMHRVASIENSYTFWCDLVYTRTSNFVGMLMYWLYSKIQKIHWLDEFRAV